MSCFKNNFINTLEQSHCLHLNTAVGRSKKGVNSTLIFIRQHIYFKHSSTVQNSRGTKPGIRKHALKVFENLPFLLEMKTVLFGHLDTWSCRTSYD